MRHTSYVKFAMRCLKERKRGNNYRYNIITKWFECSQNGKKFPPRLHDLPFAIDWCKYKLSLLFVLSTDFDSDFEILSLCEFTFRTLNILFQGEISINIYYYYFIFFGALWLEQFLKKRISTEIYIVQKRRRRRRRFSKLVATAKVRLIFHFSALIVSCDRAHSFYYYYFWSRTHRKMFI